MLPTLFYIHDHVFGIPLFGPLSLLSGVWAVVALAMIGRLAYRQGFGGDLLGAMGMLLLVGAAICFYLPSLVVGIPATKEFGLPIRGYGVMVLIGVVLGVWLAVRRAKRRGIEVDLIFNLALWLFIGGIIGARLFYVIEYWATAVRADRCPRRFEFLATLKAALNMAQGGLVIYGRTDRRRRGRIAVLAAASRAADASHCRRHRTEHGSGAGDRADRLLSQRLLLRRRLGFALGRQLSRALPPYARQIEKGRLFLHGLALASGRQVGEAGVAILNVQPDSAAEQSGLTPGEIVDQIRAQGAGDSQPVVVYPAPNEQSPAAQPDASVAAAQRALLSITGEGTKLFVYTEDRDKPAEWTLTKATDLPTRSLPVQPTQLYSAFDAGLLCLLLLAYDPFRRRDGEVLAVMLTVHPFSRFLLESIRTDEPKVYRLPFVSAQLSISQFLSALMLVEALALWAYIILRKPRLDGSDLQPDEPDGPEPAEANGVAP